MSITFLDIADPKNHSKKRKKASNTLVEWYVFQLEESLVHSQKSNSKWRKLKEIDKSERRKWSIKYRKSISYIDNQSNNQKTKHHHQNLMIECRIEISAKLIFSRFQTRKINIFIFKSTHLKIAFRYANSIKSTYATLWVSHSFRDFVKLHSSKIIVNKFRSIDFVSNIVIFVIMSCHSSSLSVRLRWTHVSWQLRTLDSITSMSTLFIWIFIVRKSSKNVTLFLLINNKRE